MTKLEKLTGSLYAEAEKEIKEIKEIDNIHTRQLASSLLTEAISYGGSAVIHLSFNNKEQHDKCIAISDALRECANKLKEMYK